MKTLVREGREEKEGEVEWEREYLVGKLVDRYLILYSNILYSEMEKENNKIMDLFLVFIDSLFDRSILYVLYMVPVTS